jgi:hypothetical protein
MDQPTPDEAVERRAKWVPLGDLRVPIGPHSEDRYLGKPFGEVLEEEQCRLVGPVEVIEDEEQGTLRRGSAEVVTEAVE